MHRCNITGLTLGFYLSYFLFFMVSDSMDVTMPLFFDSKGMSVAYLGILLTASRIARAILVVPVSRVKRSKKLRLVGMVLLLDATVLMVALATGSRWGIAAGFFLIVTTTSVFNVIMNPLLAATTDDSRLGITFGVRDVFLYLGGFLGVLATGQLLGLTGDYGQVFVAYVVVLLVLAAVIRFGVAQKTGLPGMKAQSDAKTARLHAHGRLDHRFLHYLVVNGLVVLGSTSLVYAALLGRRLGIENAGIYVLFSSHVLVAALLSVFGGMIIDRFDKKRVYVFKTGLYVLAFILLSLGSRLFFVLGVLVLGVQAALANIDSAYLFSIFRRHDTDRYWGVTSFVSLAAGSLGVLTFGYLWEAGEAIFRLSLPVIALSFFLSLKLPKKAV